jgi:rRNA maturation endonuclease Nob1
MTKPGTDDADLIVLRCSACGDTFPVHRGEEATACPSCGSEDVHPASEPLL